LNASNTNLTDVRISLNSASENGGGMSVFAVNINFTTVQIVNNVCDGIAAGIYSTGKHTFSLRIIYKKKKHISFPHPQKLKTN